MKCSQKTQKEIKRRRKTNTFYVSLKVQNKSRDILEPHK